MISARTVRRRLTEAGLKYNPLFVIAPAVRSTAKNEDGLVKVTFAHGLEQGGFYR